MNGDCGNWRELCDFGDRTFDGSSFRDAVLTARTGPGWDEAAVIVLVRFLGTLIPFSLSEPPAISELWRFKPRGRAGLDGCVLAPRAVLEVATAD